MSLQEIEPDDALLLLRDSTAIFVDLRDHQSYQVAHIPGAVQLTDEDVQDFIRKTDAEAKVVVYCYHGHMSQGGAMFFQQNGLSQAMSMRDGFEGWRQRFPTEIQSA